MNHNASLFPITREAVKAAAEARIKYFAAKRDEQRPLFEARLAAWKKPSIWESFKTGDSREAPEWTESNCDWLPHLAPEHHMELMYSDCIKSVEKIVKHSESVLPTQLCWLCKDDMEALGL